MIKITYIKNMTPWAAIRFSFNCGEVYYVDIWPNGKNCTFKGSKVFTVSEKDNPLLSWHRAADGQFNIY
jgi:hypothetical protein